MIITRTRDIDPCIRALVFNKTLRHFNPAQLTIAQRETLVRDGLGDRDDKVKAAAADMVDYWFDIARSEPDSDFLTGVFQFLSLFDLTNEEGLAIALDALRSIFVTKASAVRKVVFPGECGGFIIYLHVPEDDNCRRYILARHDARSCGVRAMLYRIHFSRLH